MSGRGYAQAVLGVASQGAVWRSVTQPVTGLEWLNYLLDLVFGNGIRFRRNSFPLSSFSECICGNLLNLRE